MRISWKGTWAILIMAACAEQTCGFVASPLGFRSLPRSSGRTGAIKMPRISMTKATDDMSSASSRPKVAVVGAGWSGWAAAKALSENDCDVILLDGLPDPSGEKPYLTPTGKPFEPGTRGFWKDYPNIESMLNSVGVPPKTVLTDFEPSSFFSPFGLEATAPVFGDATPLPSPLGQILATFPNFKRLPIPDRVTMGGLLYAMLDFTRDEKTFEGYDRMTAHELFIRMGLSKRLVDDFIRPTLLVGLFKPPEELSAAVAMELLYYYALAHQDSFDVRWVSNKTIAESMINPLSLHIAQGQNPVDVRGGCRVEEVTVEGDRVTSLRYTNQGTSTTIDGLDGCVLALGAKGMKSVVSGSPSLARACPELSASAALGAIDVVSCRIWLDRFVPCENPANVLASFPQLRGAGGTFFLLDQINPDHEYLWGGDEPQGSVLACDFYNAGSVATLSDEDIISLMIDDMIPTAVPAFKDAKVVDSHVQRFPGAVTWFSPGSYKSRPPLQTRIKNLVCAGDWVRMGDREHGAKGLCQERAYVSGLEAANALSRTGSLKGRKVIHEVIPVRDDEAQVQAGRLVNKGIMDVLGRVGLDSPWVR